MKNTMGSSRHFLFNQVILTTALFLGIILATLLVLQKDVLAKNDNQNVAQGAIDNNPTNHPSGNDRNEEHGKSDTQGKSQSNPDGNGADKRRDGKDGSNAQTQGSADWDDNNGCGNDNDFADDNRGNCKGPSKADNDPASSPQPHSVPPSSEDPLPASNNRITICHATGSSTNPYVEITISENGVENGHQGHPDDIIPVSSDGCGQAVTTTDNGDDTVSSDTDESSSSDSDENVVANVLGAISELPKTGVDLLKFAWILLSLPAGLLMSRYKKGQFYILLRILNLSL